MSTQTSATVARESLREVAVLRPRGIARFAAAAFLGVWCTGWAAGELAVGSFLVAFTLRAFGADIASAQLDPHTEAAGLGVLAFMMIWFTGWTVGGVGALRSLAALLVERHRIALGVGMLEVESRIGPLRSVRRLALRDVLSVVAPRAGELVAHTVLERVVLTTLGTKEERASLARLLDDARAPDAIDLAALHAVRTPIGFVADADGATLWRRSSVPAFVAFIPGFLALHAVLATLRMAGDDPTLVPVGVVALGLASLTVWLLLPRGDGFAAVAGVVSRRARVGSFVHGGATVATALAVRRAVDGDGDVSHTLVDVSSGKVLLASGADPMPCVHLGRWLARRAMIACSLDADVDRELVRVTQAPHAE